MGDSLNSGFLLDHPVFFFFTIQNGIREIFIRKIFLAFKLNIHPIVFFQLEQGFGFVIQKIIDHLSGYPDLQYFHIAGGQVLLYCPDHTQRGGAVGFDMAGPAAVLAIHEKPFFDGRG